MWNRKSSGSSSFHVLIKRPALITQDQLVTLLTQQHSTTHQPLLDPRSHQVFRIEEEVCKLHGDGCIMM